MSRPTLEERVAALEAAMAHLLTRLTAPAAPRDWRSTLGMFANSPIMHDIDEAGRKIREADRAATLRR